MRAAYWNVRSHTHSQIMNIRPDLQSASHLLSRLVEYANVFRNNDMKRWPHLKNNEDFEKVYKLPWPQRGPLEEIYGTGRDLSVFMSSRLIEFNHAASFPTLKSFADSFTGGWIDQVNILEDASRLAKEKCAELENPPWASRQMISLFDEQIGLLYPIKQTIEALKSTDLYKWESGTQQSTIYATEYSKILECVHSIGKMFERLPDTYRDKGEESLRDHILVCLGAAIIGSATGETFNKRGKTDILVRGATSNEFIGECKFWRGKEVYFSTIDQLLTYLSWRDTNAAVILFVPNQDFSSVIQKIRTYTAEHPSFLRAVSERDETWQNYQFKMNGDPSRVVNIAIMAYHIPS